MLNITYINFDDAEVTDVIENETIEHMNELATYYARTAYNRFLDAEDAMKNLAQDLVEKNGNNVLKIVAVY